MTEQVARLLAALFLGVVVGMLIVPVFKALTAAIHNELQRFRVWRDTRRLDGLAARTWPAREYERIEEDW